MNLEDHPGYLGLTSAGVLAIHADWPAYATQHGWISALTSLCMFPAGTAFRPLDDIDRCVLLLAQGVSTNDDPFSETNFHVALWHDDALDLARRGLLRGPVGVTERVHQLNTLREIENRAPVTSWADTNDGFDLAPLYARMPNGALRMIVCDWESYDDENTDWLCIPPEASLSVTEEGWLSLDDALSARFTPPPSLTAKLTPILDAGLYDTAVREISVQLEHTMRRSCGSTDAYGQKLVDLFVQSIAKKQIVPDASLKVLRTELRTSFKFVRNEFAHNAVEMSRSRGLSLLERMSELYESVTELAT